MLGGVNDVTGYGMSYVTTAIGPVVGPVPVVTVNAPALSVDVVVIFTLAPEPAEPPAAILGGDPGDDVTVRTPSETPVNPTPPFRN